MEANITSLEGLIVAKYACDQSELRISQLDFLLLMNELEFVRSGIHEFMLFKSGRINSFRKC